MTQSTQRIEPPTLLTAHEAAEWCRITVNTLNYLRMHDRFAPATKIGRRCFWKPEHLNAWIDQQQETVA